MVVTLYQKLSSKGLVFEWGLKMGDIPPSEGYLSKCIKLGGDTLKEGVNG